MKRREREKREKRERERREKRGSTGVPRVLATFQPNIKPCRAHEVSSVT